MGVVPAPAGYFLERAEARALDDIAASGRTAVLSQVLAGLGGVGKTQLAAAYARRALGAGTVDLLMWVSASSRETVVAQYAQAARQLTGTDEHASEDAARRFLAWLATTSRRWLIVLDDLTAPGHLRDLWPPATGSGRTIVTTRRRDAALVTENRRMIVLGVFTDLEARTYLRSALAEHPRLADDVEGVARDLANLPLALGQAVAFMRDRDLTCADYRRRFTDRRRRLAELFPEADAVPDQYQRTIDVTWSLSIEIANELAPRGLALPLLRLASLLDPNGAPARVFEAPAALRWLTSAWVAGADDGDEVTADHARDGLRCLHRLSLVTVDDGVVRVHALVQRAVRERLGVALAAEMARTAVDALWWSWDAGDDRDWPLLAMAVQVAHDASDEDLKRGAFDKLVDMLDRKRLSPGWNARAWAATYVLRDKFDVLLPLVLDCLAGDQVNPPRSEADARASGLGPPARVTPEAASSLASVFEVVEDWHTARPERAIPVLRDGLVRWSLRRRFVEALARYRTPDALLALQEFALAELESGADHQVLGEVAEALGEFGQEFGDTERASSIGILERIIVELDFDPRTRRAAVESVARLAGQASGAAPEVDEEEIVRYLNPLDERGQYSDWRVVRAYADRAYERIARGELTPQLLTALIDGFAHQQTFVRRVIARCLGIAEDPRARAALVDELGGPPLSADVRQACREALATQIDNAPTPALRAARRWLVVDAARDAASAGRPLLARELLDLVTRSTKAEDCLVDEGGFEVLAQPSHSDHSGNSSVVVGLVETEEAAIDPEAAEFATDQDYAEVGEGWESKYRFRAVSRSDSGVTEVSVAATTWEQGAAFHRALRRAHPRLREYQDRMIEGWLRGAVQLPGIACMHCIVVSSDDEVLMARRGRGTPYAPGRWSASFEEQLTGDDFAPGRENPAVHAARRGFVEELGLPADQVDISVPTAVIEMPIMNVSLVAVLRAPWSSIEILEAGRGQELDELRFVSTEPAALLAEAARSDLHPTSGLRLRRLARLLGG
ncbi:HEAT repeat domain-containing protein [Pseudofrankia saprophytica]|uniref:HEAT repeat domain-containing protein n=1 Tax=Pseudofrankia saprophytica TaxID=298655 RepID=UPI001E41A5C9|nr:HEAT repeat domain-containing protein [Pseudofrankia saprophytica]